jgi:uncharacterized protein (DUF433 family)
MVDKFDEALMTPREAARHLEIPDSTMYYWLSEEAAGEPLVHRVAAPRRGWLTVPFIALIEAYVLRSLREAKFSKAHCRKIAEEVRKRYRTPYGLATKRFATDGIDVYLEEHGELARVWDGQTPIREVIADNLRYIEWDDTDGYPVRLRLRQYPDVAPVIIDPRFGWGSPVIESNRVPVESVASLWPAGESIHSVAYEYDLRDEQVEAIVRAYKAAA